MDLSILDVMQIFGRAGRPQYETHGVGYILTSQDKLNHYVALITQQLPIESRLVFHYFYYRKVFAIAAGCALELVLELTLTTSFLLLSVGSLRRWWTT